MTVSAGGAITFTSDSTNSEQNTRTAKLRAERAEKNVRDLLPRTACWLRPTGRWRQRQPIEGCQGAIEVFQAIAIPLRA